MKRAKFVKLFIVALSLAFVGCQSDSTVSDKNDYGTNIRMAKGVTYKIEKGDEIEKISDNPEIKIESNLDTGETNATLLSGEASIIRY